MKRRLGEVRKSLAVPKVETKGVKDISLVEVQVCVVMTSRHIELIIIEALMSKGIIS